jgi:hypothetical protein
LSCTSARVAAIYQFRVAGHLDDHWSAAFEKLAIARRRDTSTLTGPVADQAELHGILGRLRDIGATLLALYPLDEGCPACAGERTHTVNALPRTPDG